MFTDKIQFDHIDIYPFLSDFLRRENTKRNTYSDIAIDSSISRSTKRCVIIKSRLILAHGSFRTRVVCTIRFLFLAIDARIAVGALAPIALWQIYTSSTVVARLRCALIDINFAASSREASWTIAMYTVSHWHAETAVLTHVIGALDRLALFANN